MEIEYITNGGENGQEVAAPAENTAVETGDEGARGQEVAEPAGNVETAKPPVGSEDEPSTAPEGGGEGENGVPTGKPEQSPEDRAQFAAARRKAERDKAMEVERIRADYARQQDMLIANMGLVHPETGRLVQNRAEYDSMQSYMRKQTEQSLARKAGMTEEEWQRHIESSPAVQAAREMQRRAEAEQQAARAERVRQELREDLVEITKLDGSVKTFDDLRAVENWPQIEAKMKRGYSMLDAYRLANMDAIAERKAAAAKQQAINATAQKQHMQRTEQRGTGGVVVPSDVMAMYREMMPGLSEAEYTAHYAKGVKK